MRIIIPFLCIALLGLAVLPLLTVKLAPSRDLPALTVYYSMPNNSSRIVEMEVTSKLEGMLGRTKGVRKIRSVSSNGYASITLEFDRYTDMEMARFEVSTIVRQIWPQMPEEVTYPRISPRKSDEKSNSPFIVYLLNAPATPYYIAQYAEEYIKPVLSQLEGIYQINVSGAMPMEWQLEYDTYHLASSGVTVGDIRTAISEYLMKQSMGMVSWEAADGNEQLIRLTVSGEEMQGVFKPEAITVRNSRNEMIGLERLIKVVHKEEESTRYYRVNGLNSVYLSVMADESANQLKLGREIRMIMNDLSQSFPAGYRMSLSYDNTEFIDNTLQNIYYRSGLTVLILLLFVFLITRSLRYLWLIILSISINLAIAFLFYYIFHLEIQVYSLVGITLSLNLIIDNTIVMVNHLMYNRNRKIFLALFAATLTTIAALSVVFFLDESIRLNLEDFSAIIIINLSVSLGIALWLIPALMKYIRITEKESKSKTIRSRRILVYITKLYENILRFLLNWRKTVAFALLLAFGTPLFLLPKKIEKDSEWAKKYNKVFDSGNELSKTVIPWVLKYTGGALKLFIEKVREGSYGKNEPGESVIFISVVLPNGTTLKQMNDLIVEMETFLSTFPQIKRFESNVHLRNSNIRVYFQEEFQRSSFIESLKMDAYYKGVELGSGSWRVSGYNTLDDSQSFSNIVQNTFGGSSLYMTGYNYDQLYEYALQVSDSLLKYRRIPEVVINPEYSYHRYDYREFYTEIDGRKLTESRFFLNNLYQYFTPFFMRGQTVGYLSTEDGNERLKLYARQSREYDVWNMTHIPIGSTVRKTKLNEIAGISITETPHNILKENQEYLLCLQYAYNGSGNQEKRITDRIVDNFKNILPMGYTLKKPEKKQWKPEEKRQYLLIFLVVAIIWFITGILFNSLRQPFAVIFVVPVAYIGVFLTFYKFNLRFDQGGFSSFILLCGITVNACIYILSEYNNIMKKYPHYNPIRAYLKAWNSKVVPIFLTVVSTILGFIPFIVGQQKEAFWFPLAAGTIGGLIFSLLGVILYLPLFTLKRQKKKKKGKSQNMEVTIETDT